MIKEYNIACFELQKMLNTINENCSYFVVTFYSNF